MWCMWCLGASFSSCQRVVCPHACQPGLRLLERLRSSTYTPSNAPPSPPPFLITPPPHPATTVVDAQNALTSSVLEQCGSRDQFRDLFTHLYNYERYGTPYKKGSRWVGGCCCRSAGLQECWFAGGRRVDRDSTAGCQPVQGFGAALGSWWRTQLATRWVMRVLIRLCWPSCT